MTAIPIARATARTRRAAAERNTPKLKPRQILVLIDAYLADPYIPLEDRRALWDILTALRGPDRPRDRKAVHHVPTAIIRAHAFPATAQLLEKHAKAGFKPKMDRKHSLAKAAESLKDGSGHFHTHAWRAILALTRF